MRATCIRALIPIDTEPSEIVINRFLGFPSRALLVRVFNAEHVRAVLLPSKEPRKHGGTGIADVKQTCRTRRKPHSYHGEFSKVTLFQEYQCDGFGGDGLFSTNDPKMLHRLRLHMDVAGGNSKNLCDFRLHFRKVRQQFWTLGKNVRVDVADLVSLLADVFRGLTQELQAGNAL